MSTPTTINDIPIDVIRIIGKKLGISQLTKVCIAVPKLDKLLADHSVEKYKSLIQYEINPLRLLEETCRWDSAILLLRVILDFPKIGIYTKQSIGFCWKNNYFNVLDVLYDIHSDDTYVRLYRENCCTNSVVRGDMDKLKHLVAYYSHPVDGDANVNKLMLHLKHTYLEDVDVLVHLVQLGLIKNGIEKVLIKMCYEQAYVYNIEKLYNAAKHLIDINIIKNAKIHHGGTSVEITYFLYSIGGLSEDVDLLEYRHGVYYSNNAKEFIQKYNITVERVITGLFVYALETKNKSDIQYILPLNWISNAKICKLVNGYIKSGKTDMIEMLLPYMEKILAYEENEDTTSIIRYLYCIDYVWSGTVSHADERIFLAKRDTDVTLEKIQGYMK